MCGAALPIHKRYGLPTFAMCAERPGEVGGAARMIRPSESPPGLSAVDGWLTRPRVGVGLF